MPLQPGNTPQDVSSNIRELSGTNRPQNQVIAIALNNARKTAKKNKKSKYFETPKPQGM